ncbi:MAG: A/G-specific adenine glycosylase, partial [Verrucomicrobiota bacterium]|nr:A/G-specific adenine glycosylase [Verrucomicrobiota bacterium]
MRLRFIVAPLLKWFAENARDLPWRRTRDPYAIWVSEIMLQQTQVKTVIPYWERWMNRLPDVAALANAREDTVIKLWEGLGYYSRVRNMQKAARLIPDEHGGRFPRDLAGVLALPGVGRYTGGAVCSIAFNQPEPIVDGNVIRVLTRVAGIEEPPKAKQVLEQIWAIAD